MSVQVLENFLTESDCKKISSYLDGISSANQVPHYLVALGFETSNQASSVSLENPVLPLSDNSLHNEVSILVTESILGLRQKMEDFFLEKMSLVNCNYVQMTQGASNPLHADRTHLDGTPYHDGEELEFSALIYLNDFGKDYTGGEIVFPLQDLQIEPKTGMAVFFKGDVDHQHEVFEVSSGIRKNIVLFFGKRGNTSDKIMFGDEHSGVDMWISIK